MSVDFQKLLFIGATSGICRYMCYNLISPGAKVYLASRDLNEQSRIAKDIRIRCMAEVYEGTFEADDFSNHKALAYDVWDKLGGIDCVVVATGLLGDQSLACKDNIVSWGIISSNYVGPVSILTFLANLMEEQGHGVITVLSSVAGDRGRQSNYIYGSAKGGMTRFLQGLRNRLHKSGVRVVTVKLGFVDTKMVFGKPGMFLVITPEKAARLIERAIVKGRDVVYIPFFWMFIMMIIRHIPERIFKSMKL
jgi:short-subunit dehydrogenase